MERGVTPPGASANERANIRLTVRHGGHAGVAGWQEDDPFPICYFERWRWMMRGTWL